MNTFYALLFDLTFLALVLAGLASIIGWQTGRAAMLSVAARAAGFAFAMMFAIPLARSILSDARDRVPIFAPQVTVIDPVVRIPSPPGWVWVVVVLGHNVLIFFLWRRRRAAVEGRRRARQEFERSRGRERQRVFVDNQAPPP